MDGYFVQVIGHFYKSTERRKGGCDLDWLQQIFRYCVTIKSKWVYKKWLIVLYKPIGGLNFMPKKIDKG